MVVLKCIKIQVCVFLCLCVYAGAVSCAILPCWLSQTPAIRKWHRRSPQSAHVALLSVILDTHSFTHTDKHPSLFPSSLSRRMAPCVSNDPLPSCPAWALISKRPPAPSTSSHPPSPNPKHTHGPPPPSLLALLPKTAASRWGADSLCASSRLASVRPGSWWACSR